MSRSSLRIVFVRDDDINKARLFYSLTWLPLRHGGERDSKDDTPQVTTRPRAEATVV